MVLVIALCWCWQCLLTVCGNLLPHIVTPLDVTIVAWCCRQTQDVLQPAECQQQQYRHQRDSGQHVSSLPDVVQEVAAICLLKIGVLSCLRPITHYHCSHSVLLQNLALHKLGQVYCNWNDGKNAKCLTAYIIQTDTGRMCPAINWVIRGIRREFRVTW